MPPNIPTIARELSDDTPLAVMPTPEACSYYERTSRDHAPTWSWETTAASLEPFLTFNAVSQAPLAGRGAPVGGSGGVSPVADVLARFVLAVDDRDWQAVTRYLADTVRRDYSSLTGAHGHGRVVGSGVTRRDAGRVRRA